MSTRNVRLLLTLAHLLPVAAWLTWNWQTGFLLMAALHLSLAAVTLIPCGPFAGRALKSFAGGAREVCLTIDDGPGADTAAVLELLAAHQAKAVFFLIGTRAALRPDDVRAIAAAGHLIANHTQHHAAGRHWFSGPERQRREILECQEILTSFAGRRPAWFRPPAGFANPFTAPVLRESGLRCAGWSVRGFDGSDRNVPRILRRLVRGVRSGAILLVHQGQPHHTGVLRELLCWLKEHDWRIVLPKEFTVCENQPASY